MYGGRCAALTRRPQAGRGLLSPFRLTAPSTPRRKSPRRTVRLVAMVLDEVRGDAPVRAAVLDKLEERYLRPIEQAANLEGLLADPLFLADPINHPALFSDPGPIHVRDVAACYRDLAETANGLLISRRPPERLAFLVAYGLLATYLHDIGMLDLTTAGGRGPPPFPAPPGVAAPLLGTLRPPPPFSGPPPRRPPA